jgi:hypothetical protein
VTTIPTSLTLRLLAIGRNGCSAWPGTSAHLGRNTQEVEVKARAQGKPALGTRAIQAQHPHTRPERLKRNPRSLGHASTRQACGSCANV